MGSNAQVLFQKLQELAGASGFVVFAIGDYYVQFAKEPAEEEMVFEAVSHLFVDAVREDLGTRFTAMGFSLDTENYYKHIENRPTPKTILEVERIFREFYEVDYDQPFMITEDIY